MADDAFPYRPVTIGPILADHPLLDSGPIVDLVATYGPDAGRPVPEAGLYVGLMSDGWLQQLAYPDGDTAGGWFCNHPECDCRDERDEDD